MKYLLIPGYSLWLLLSVASLLQWKQHPWIRMRVVLMLSFAMIISRPMISLLIALGKLMPDEVSNVVAWNPKHLSIYRHTSFHLHLVLNVLLVKRDSRSWPALDMIQNLAVWVVRSGQVYCNCENLKGPQKPLSLICWFFHLANSDPLLLNWFLLTLRWEFKHSISVFYSAWLLQ